MKFTSPITIESIISLSALVDVAINMLCVLVPVWMHAESNLYGRLYIGQLGVIQCPSTTVDATTDVPCVYFTDVSTRELALMLIIIIAGICRSAVSCFTKKYDMLILTAIILLECAVIGLTVLDIRSRYLYVAFYCYLLAPVLNVCMIVTEVILAIRDRTSSADDHVELIDEHIVSPTQ